MGYPTDDEFREAMTNRAPPRSRTSNDVTRDRRVQRIVDSLYEVDFGVNMDGYSRARIAQVITAVVDAEREAIANDLRRVAAVSSDRRDDEGTARFATILEIADGIHNRYPIHDVPTRDLWKAAQPTRDWIA